MNRRTVKPTTSPAHRRAVRAYQKRNNAKGQCRLCVWPIHKAGLCGKHYDAQRARMKARYDKRRAAGLCGACGRKALPGRAFCKRHRTQREPQDNRPVVNGVRRNHCGNCGGLGHNRATCAA